MSNRIAIIECFNNSQSAKNGNSTIAHIRNNKIIAKYLGCEYFITEADLDYAGEMKWDTLLFTNSSAFADHKDIKKLINNNKSARKIFITNDYKTNPHSELNKYEYEVIGNFRAKENDKKKRKHYFLNLNALMAKAPLKQTEKKLDCVYWGACREDRIPYFQKYFMRNNIYVSTTLKARPKFIEAGCSARFIQPVDWNKSLTNLFRYSLYIEDNWIHQNFHNLANRWYEAGIYNNVTFFDRDCLNTVYQSEIADVFDEYYTVGSFSELMRKIAECNKDWQKHLEVQKEWHKIDLITRNKVLQEIKRIVEG